MDIYKLSPELKLLLFQKQEDEPLTPEEKLCCQFSLTSEQINSYELNLDDPETIETFTYYFELEARKQEMALNLQTRILGNSIGTENQSGVLLSQRRRSRLFWLKWLAAAVLVLTAGTYVWYNISRTPVTVHAEDTATTIIPQVSPGVKHASLTLSDGTEKSVSELSNGAPVYDGAVQIGVLGKSMIVYRYTTAPDQRVLFNKLVTHKKEEFGVILPDSTVVWLNANSSLKYPVNFANNERRVELNGEAYFEVHKKLATPFRVITLQSAEIVAKGTKFNVKAYEDDSLVETTLIEGSVQVKVSTDSTNLEAGEQVIITKDGLQPTVKLEETAGEVAAWKNGLIILEGQDIRSVMNQVKRWYGVEVTIDTSVHHRTLTGSIKRAIRLDQFVEIFRRDQDSLKFQWAKDTLFVSQPSK